jgi:hypothetical protein
MKPGDTQHLFPRHEVEISKADARLEALPESKRWDPVPGSEGRRAPESASEDEDAEGRSETEQLVDDGVEQAEREQAKQAAAAAKNKK